MHTLLVFILQPYVNPTWIVEPTTNEGIVFLPISVSFFHLCEVIWVITFYCFSNLSGLLHVSHLSDSYLSWTFMTGSCTGLKNARYYRYSVMSSWWWVKYHLKHVEQFANINKLYIVASCWIIIDAYYAMHGPLNIKKKNKKTSPGRLYTSFNCNIAKSITCARRGQ